MLCKGFVAKNGELGPGIRATFATSIELPDYPIGTGFWDFTRANVYLNAAIVEANANGRGCRLTEIRSVDACGSIPAAALKKATTIGPPMNFGFWCEYIKKFKLDK